MAGWRTKEGGPALRASMFIPGSRRLVRATAGRTHNLSKGGRVHRPSRDDIQMMSKKRRNYTELFGYLSTARLNVVLALEAARGGHARRIPEVGGRQGAS